jgi:hypothetical protein
MTALWPTYQATRGSWLAPYATRVAMRENGPAMIARLGIVERPFQYEAERRHIKDHFFVVAFSDGKPDSTFPENALINRF